MAEDWLDCPVLGPGWKRRESFRKSGATCGRSDTYYQSPTGERIRSKVELRRFLGPDCDLSRFDFKRGVLQYLPAKGASQKKKKKKKKKKKRRVWLKKKEPSLKEKQSLGSAPRFCQPPPPATLAISCENCGASISGDDAQRQRLRTLCRGCRAQRNAFNREQRMFKRVGCGECKACQLTVDCGTCPDCTMRVSRPGAPRLPGSQCAQRRCLKIVKKSFGCGVCSGCKVKEDCGTCCICERRGRPELKRQWKCLLRRCLKKRIKKKPRGLATRKLPGRRRRVLMPPPPPQAYGPFSTTKHSSSHRQSRKCGVCAACRRCVGCGQCDFCRDKPKFGGCNQKCRWRQCLQFAMKGVPVIMEEFHPGFAMPPGTDLVILQEQEGREGVPVLVPRSKPRGSLFPAPGCIVIEECPNFGVFISPPPIKQEVEAYGDHTFGAAFPPSSEFPPGFPIKGVDRAQLPLAVKQEETWSEEEEDMNADTPVIMEIYSLSGAAPTRAGSCGVLDSVLQEFLAELNELPLPAHWEVLPPRGPDLCITQRSPSSTMASAVIHIQPGLYFHVVVQDVPVPANHELYTAHPLRLTTVDEVVELICNLEAYHLCPGFPGIGGQGSRSPDCDVLVYEGRCQACCLPAPCPHKEWQ